MITRSRWRLRRIVGATHEQCAARLGRRPLARWLNEGLLAGLAAPLRYRVTGAQSPEHRAVPTRVETWPAALENAPEGVMRYSKENGG